MHDERRFFIDGEWQRPANRRELDVINPATERPIGKILLGTAEDVDAAVIAARAAFQTFSLTSRAERIDLLKRIIVAYQRNSSRLAQLISAEMGCPLWLSEQGQVGLGLGHLTTALEVLERYEFEEQQGRTRVIREPIGVCGLITPWNWPLNQIGCKVAPALAVGCTVVLKPSEVSPLSAHVFAEILAEAGVPRGVFNLVDGDGPTVGEALARHPDVDMMSFTGSTRAGALVAKAAADTVKRVSQELGGKSPNIILDDADLPDAVTRGMRAMVLNSGQSCNAPSRMLVPESMYERAVTIAKQVAEQVAIGDPLRPGIDMGPVANGTQFERIQALLEAGTKEGARVVTGGTGRPAGIEQGYFVKPTVFADVHNKMSIAQQEIFGPVLVMIPYRTEAEAIDIANDTVYGLSGYIQSGDPERAMRVAAKLRTGMVHINGAAYDIAAPFGGYKQSGNGREWGGEGFREFLETKAVMSPA